MSFLYEYLPCAQSWFQDSVRQKFGNRRELKFWIGSWFYQSKSRELFLHLFARSENKSRTVEEFGSWRGGSWHWELKWSRQLETEEQEMALHLQEILAPLRPDPGIEDRWIWLLDRCSSYSVKSAYKNLINKSEES